MSDQIITLADLAARSGCDTTVGLIEEVTTVAPEINVLPARTVRGSSYYVGRRTAIPTGGFRDINEGRPVEKSTYVRDVKSLHFFDLQMQLDEAAVIADDRSLGDLLADEATGAAKGAGITIGKQLYYGVNADAKGFIGLHAQYAEQLSASSDASNTTTAFLVWPNVQGVHWVVGNDGELAWSGWTKQRVTLGAGNHLMSWVGNFRTMLGLNVGSDKSVYRIKGISSASSAKYLTDGLGWELYHKVPIDRRNQCFWLMNSLAVSTLQKSRSSIGNVPANTGGSPAFSGYPDTLAGRPIVVTDMITSTENSTTI